MPGFFHLTSACNYNSTLDIIFKPNSQVIVFVFTGTFTVINFILHSSTL